MFYAAGALFDKVMTMYPGLVHHLHGFCCLSQTVCCTVCHIIVAIHHRAALCFDICHNLHKQAYDTLRDLTYASTPHMFSQLRVVLGACLLNHCNALSLGFWHAAAAKMDFYGMHPHLQLGSRAGNQSGCSQQQRL